MEKHNKEKNKKTYLPVQIQPQQVKHFKRIMEILKHEYGYLDVSPFGAGKTHITYAVASSFRLNVIVVGPKSTLSNWKKWSRIYGINLIGILTYQSLRGQSGKVSHNLLEVINGEYVATDLFEQCVRSGLLLVFDEYHNLKNDNTQLASAHALVKSLVKLVRMGYKARIALLSGTPCEVKDYVTSTFKMLGIILSEKLYNYNRSSREYELIGIQEAIDRCMRYDPDETLAISCCSVNKITAKTICHDLYTRVLKRFVVSSMPPPPIEVPKESRNYYVLMPDKDVKRLKEGLLLFKSATNYRHEIQEVDYSGINWGDVTTSRLEIDSAKIPTVCRLANENLINNPNCKVLIYCNYKRDMRTAEYLLSKYDPLVMDGSTSEKERLDIVNKFQDDNNEYRVIISNPKVGGIGIDLDDKYGTRPRIMYVLPSYFFTDQYQATGRIHRIGTKSKATVYFVYSRAFPYETGILNSMANKSQVVRSMVTEEQANIKFPGEYDELLELTAEEEKSGIKPTLEGVDGFENDKNNDEIGNDEVNNNKIKSLINNDQDNMSPLDLDKNKTYSLFLSLIEEGKPEQETIKVCCEMMFKSVYERLNDDLKLVTEKVDFDSFKTIDDMIAFVEGFHV